MFSTESAQASVKPRSESGLMAAPRFCSKCHHDWKQHRLAGRDESVCDACVDRGANDRCPGRPSGSKGSRPR